jgi:hypothetical protein
MARYWVGGTGNTNDTAHWSDADGGSGGFSVPTSTTDVFFTSGSASGDYTVTINAAFNCANFTTAAPASGNMTLAGSSAWGIYGSLSFYNGMVRSYTGAITFAATATGNTITFNTTMASATTFNGSGGGWTLQDAWNNGTANITVTNGTLDTNGQTVTGGALALGSGTKTLTLGASTINLSSTSTALNFETNGTNFTFNCNTSTINCTGNYCTFRGNGKTFNTVTMVANGTSTVQVIVIYGANTFANLTTTTGSNKVDCLTLVANQTVTGTFTVTGAATTRILVTGNISGGPVTITAAAVSLSYVDFANITCAGAATWSGTSVGDCGGTSGLTSTTPVNRYWVGTNGGNWSDTANWSSTSGGASGATMPLPQDTAYIDAASFAADGKTVTLDILVYGNLDFSALDQTITVAFGSSDRYFYLNNTWSSNITTSGTGVLYILNHDTSTATTFNMAGSTIANAMLFWVSPSATKNLTGGGTNTNNTGILNATYGTLALDSSTYTTKVFNCDFNSLGATTNLGGATINISSTGSGGWVVTAGGTLTAGTSTIKYTDTSGTAITFAGGGKTYYNLEFAPGSGGKAYTISGNNTFNNISVSNVTAAFTIKITNSSTQTVTTFTVNGGLAYPITLTNTSSTTKGNLSCASGTINCNYLLLSNTNATGGATWNAWESYGNGNTSGWNIFSGSMLSVF